MPCLLKLGNSDEMIYMWTSDKGVWPTQHHVECWDHMWETGKQHGMELYMHVYNMCLNGELPWAAKQAEAYVHAYQLCLNPSQTQMEKSMQHCSTVPQNQGLNINFCNNLLQYGFLFGTTIHGNIMSTATNL